MVKDCVTCDNKGKLCCNYCRDKEGWKPKLNVENKDIDKIASNNRNFEQGQVVYAITANTSYEGKMVYLPERVYFICKYKDKYVVQELMGAFKVARDVFVTKKEAEEEAKKY